MSLNCNECLRLKDAEEAALSSLIVERANTSGHVPLSSSVRDLHHKLQQDLEDARRSRTTHIAMAHRPTI